MVNENVVVTTDQYGNPTVVSGSTSGSSGQSIEDVYYAKAKQKQEEAFKLQAEQEVALISQQQNQQVPLKQTVIPRQGASLYGGAGRVQTQQGVSIITKQQMEQRALESSQLYQMQNQQIYGGASQYTPKQIEEIQSKQRSKGTTLSQQVKKGEITNLEIIESQPFFSVEGQKARMRNIGSVFGEIGQNFAGGFQQAKQGQLPSQLIKGATVAPRYRDTFIGDVAGFISSPANIIVQPAMVASGAPLLRGFYGAAFGGKIGYYGYRAVERQITLTPEERAYLKTTEAKQSMGIGFTGQEEEVRNRGRFNQELAAFTSQRESAKLQYQQAGINQGLTGSELTSYVNTNLDRDYRKGVKDYYLSQGYSESKANELTSRIIQGQAEETPFVYKLPFSNQMFNAGAILESISIFGGDKKAFEKSIRENFAGQGLSQAEIDRRVSILMKERSIRGRAEIPGYLGIEVGGELTGQGLFTKAAQKLATKGTQIPLKGAGWFLFKEGFKATAPAGIVEGSLSVAAQQDIRARQRNFNEIAFGAGVGALTAGTFGGLAIGLSVNKPAASRIVQGIGYVMDPYELPGDIVAGGIERVTGMPKAQFFKTGVKETLGFSAEGLSKSAKAGRKAAGIISFAPTEQMKGPSNVFNMIAGTPTEVLQAGEVMPVKTKKPTQTNVPTRSKVPTNIFTNIFNPTNVPVNTNINVPTDTKVPTDPFSNIFTQTNVPTDTNVPTNTMVNVPTNVPVITPIWRIPPPLPLGFGLPFVTGGGSGSGRSKQTYVDELAVGQSLLNSMIGGNVPKKIKLYGNPPKKSKGKRK